MERLNDSIGHTFGQSWDRKLRPVQTFLNPGRDLTLKSNLWRISKMPSPRPSTSPAASLDIKKTLQYASTPLDYVFGIGLYLAAIDMALHPGNFQGYNNEIVIAGSEAVIGHNPGINESEQISKTTGDKSFEGKIAAPAGTDHMGPPSGRPAGSPTPAAVAPVAPQQHASAADRKSSSRAASTSHEEEKNNSHNRVADPQGHLRQPLLLPLLRNNTRLPQTGNPVVARPRQATKKKKTTLIAAGVGVA